jgi:hypothetical protein
MGIHLKRSSSNFTRPADTTAYAANDLVANSTTAGSVSPLSWSVGASGGRLVHVQLVKSDETDVANSALNLHLMGASPTVANGDNGALSFNRDAAIYLGSIAIGAFVAGTDNAVAVLRAGETGFVYPFVIPYATVYGLLEATAAYSPANAEVFTVALTFDKS